MTRSPLIWIIESDAAQRATLQQDLRGCEFETRGFANSRDIERRLARERPDLLLIVHELTEDDGLALCRRIRNAGDDIPILILSTLNQPADRIAGLESGADDYLGKPCVIGEVVARIHAQLRRRRAAVAGAPLANGDDIMFGDCRLEMKTRILVKSDHRIELTSGEFAVLSALASNAHRSLTRERLLELARRRDSDASERSIDVQISRLRRIIEKDPSKPRHIQTVWGYGYVFVPDT